MGKNFQQTANENQGCESEWWIYFLAKEPLMAEFANLPL